MRTNAMTRRLSLHSLFALPLAIALASAHGASVKSQVAV